MPTAGVSQLDQSRVRDCIEFSRLRSGGLRGSIETLSYMLRNYYRGARVEEISEQLLSACETTYLHMIKTLKQLKSRFLACTFASYLPRNFTKFPFSLELYSFADGWLKFNKKDYYFTRGKHICGDGRKTKFHRDQSQRYWTQLNDLFDIFNSVAQTINDLSRGFRDLNNGS